MRKIIVVLFCLTLATAAGWAEDSHPVQTFIAEPGVAADRTASADEASLMVANPLYLAWKGQEGKTVIFNRAESISGGASMPGGGSSRESPSIRVEFTLSDYSAEQAALKVTTGTNHQAETLIIPARLLPGDPSLPKFAGKEELKIGGKTYACNRYTYMTTSKAEVGRDTQGLSGKVTVWVADGIAGGIIQRNITLTIRASYDITDTRALEK
jgi:hypothetical protein